MTSSRWQEDKSLSENENDIDVEELNENGDPLVPTELLELHVELEVAGTTAEEFKSAFGNS